MLLEEKLGRLEVLDKVNELTKLLAEQQRAAAEKKAGKKKTIPPSLRSRIPAPPTRPW
jgi:hypothetical protein